MEHSGCLTQAKMYSDLSQKSHTSLQQEERLLSLEIVKPDKMIFKMIWCVSLWIFCGIEFPLALVIFIV